MLVLALLFCVIVSSSTYTYDVPLAAWAGKALFKGEHVGVSLYLTSFDTELLLRSFVHQPDNIGVLSQYVDYKIRPEVMVVFAEAQVRSEQLSTFAASLVQFRSILNGAASSLQAPFVDMSHAFDSHLINVVTRVSANDGKVFYLGKGSPLLKDILNREQKTITSNFASMGSLFNKNDKIFSNGHTDLIIVYLSSIGADKFKETDNVIADVHRYITAYTDNYVCVYTGLAYDNPEYNVDFGSEEEVVPTKRSIAEVHQAPVPAPAPAPSAPNQTVPAPSPLAPNATNGTNGTVPVFRQFFGGWFWELFVTMLVLVPLLIIGTYSIDSIQTPIFEAKKKN